MSRARRILVWLAAAVEVDAQQPVTRQQPRAFGGGIGFDAFGDYAFFRINPHDTVPWWRLVMGSLTEVQHAGADQKRCAD
jgi:hypothetical protein